MRLGLQELPFVDEGGRVVTRLKILVAHNASVELRTDVFDLDDVAKLVLEVLDSTCWLFDSLVLSVVDDGWT